jgi:hypothetical protein
MKGETAYAEEYQEELQREIEQRVAEMEREDYDFGERFSRGNYILAISIAVVSLLLLIWGAFC